MKCRYVGIMLVLSTLASPAFAWDCNYWSQSTDSSAECYKAPTTPGSSNTNTNTNGQGQDQTQGQGQNQGQGQSQTAQGGSGGTGVGVGLAASKSSSSSDSRARSDATADNAGNSQTTEFNSYTPRAPVNTAVAGFQITNAPCRFAEGLGIQTNNVGGSVGFTFKDKDCERFQYAQYMYARGQNVAGDRLMCLIKRIYEALGDDCLALVNELVVVHAEYPPGEREHRKEVHGFPNVSK